MDAANVANTANANAAIDAACTSAIRGWCDPTVPFCIDRFTWSTYQDWLDSRWAKVLVQPRDTATSPTTTTIELADTPTPRRSLAEPVALTRTTTTASRPPPPPTTTTTPQPAYLLSHIHTDHTVGLRSSWTLGTIYTSHITRALLLARFHIEPHRVRAFSYGETIPFDAHSVLLGRRGRRGASSSSSTSTSSSSPPHDPPWRSMQLTLFPSGHCPGSTVFVLDGAWGRFVYTGDLHADRCFVADYDYARPCTRFLHATDDRSERDDDASSSSTSSLLTSHDHLLHFLRDSPVGVDRVWLDTTFCTPALDTPFGSLRSAVDHVQRIVAAHPHKRAVYLNGDLVGKEDFLVLVSHRLQACISVAPERYALLRTLHDCEYDLWADEQFPRTRDALELSVDERAALRYPNWFACFTSDPSSTFVHVRPRAAWYRTRRADRVRVVEARNRRRRRDAAAAAAAAAVAVVDGATDGDCRDGRTDESDDDASLVDPLYILVSGLTLFTPSSSASPSAASPSPQPASSALSSPPPQPPSTHAAATTTSVRRPLPAFLQPPAARATTPAPTTTEAPSSTAPAMLPLCTRPHACGTDIHYVRYSSHSSRHALRRFIDAIRPRSIVAVDGGSEVDVSCFHEALDPSPATLSDAMSALPPSLRLSQDDDAAFGLGGIDRPQFARAAPTYVAIRRRPRPFVFARPPTPNDDSDADDVDPSSSSSSSSLSSSSHRARPPPPPPPPRRRDIPTFDLTSRTDHEDVEMTVDCGADQAAPAVRSRPSASRKTNRAPAVIVLDDASSPMRSVAVAPAPTRRRRTRVDPVNSDDDDDDSDAIVAVVDWCHSPHSKRRCADRKATAVNGDDADDDGDVNDPIDLCGDEIGNVRMLRSRLSDTGFVLLASQEDEDNDDDKDDQDDCIDCDSDDSDLRTVLIISQ